MPQERAAIRLLDGRQTNYTSFRSYERETSQALRSAFSFLRANADRRYSATVLMTLMDYADRMEAFDAEALRAMSDQFPTVITIGSPFSYDEETEVKSGGLVGVGVILPDRRVLLATHRNVRRQGVAAFVHEVVRNFPTPEGCSYWIHQENRPGQQFALAVGLMPYDVNRRGAVLYRSSPLQETDDAVSDMDDREIENRLRRSPRRGLNVLPSARQVPEGALRAATDNWTGMMNADPTAVASPRETSADPMNAFATEGALRRAALTDPPSAIPEPRASYGWRALGVDAVIELGWITYQDFDGTYYACWHEDIPDMLNYPTDFPSPADYRMPCGMHIGMTLGYIYRMNPRYITHLMTGYYALPQTRAAAALVLMMQETSATGDLDSCDDPFCDCHNPWLERNAGARSVETPYTYEAMETAYYEDNE